MLALGVDHNSPTGRMAVSPIYCMFFMAPWLAVSGGWGASDTLDFPGISNGTGAMTAIGDELSVEFYLPCAGLWDLSVNPICSDNPATQADVFVDGVNLGNMDASFPLGTSAMEVRTYPGLVLGAGRHTFNVRVTGALNPGFPPNYLLELACFSLIFRG